jgi:hypothetical protein
MILLSLSVLSSMMVKNFPFRLIKPQRAREREKFANENLSTIESHHFAAFAFNSTLHYEKFYKFLLLL